MPKRIDPDKAARAKPARARRTETTHAIITRQGQLPLDYRIPIDAKRYEAKHGKVPSGTGYWRFILVSNSVTANDHLIDRQIEQRYEAALSHAISVATLRRSIRIIVLP